MSKKLKRNNISPVLRVLITTGIIILVVITLFPFYWVVRTSLTPNSRIYVDAGRLLPPSPTFMNYPRVLGLVDAATSVALGGTGQSVNFLVNLKNSLIIAVGVTFFSTLFSAMAAYAFSRLHFPGRDQLFYLILAAMMVPGVVMMIPNFVFVRQMGLLNTYAGVMAPGLIMTPYAVFFLRQFFLGINKEIEEAAYLDGAGQYQTFFVIILPLMQTALVTLAVTTFINTWNDYMWPLIVGKKDEIRTLTVALGVFRSQTPQGQPDWSGLTAGTVLAIIPALAIYGLFGKKIVNSVQFSGFR
jgi:multiple sugar transport system permease protein